VLPLGKHAAFMKGSAHRIDDKAGNESRKSHQRCSQQWHCYKLPIGKTCTYIQPFPARTSSLLIHMFISADNHTV
jgi:hypothetical protein